MAEDSDLEKTEEPSPRKLEKAREEGDVPRSRELASFTLLFGAAIGFWLSGNNIIEQLENLLRKSLSFQTENIMQPSQITLDFFDNLISLVFAFTPLMALLLIASIATPALLGGLLFNSKALVPKFDRLDPIQGFSNLFSKKSLVELFKAIAKTLLIGGFSWIYLSSEFETLFAMTQEPLELAIGHQGQLLLIAFSILVAAMAVIALFDAPYQLFEYSQKLMMTRQELRDEAKESEGNPEIKAKIRAQQREMARRRMMSQVPSADVIVTNPTHYAVALKYSENSVKAPYVVAKGVDQTALRIKEIAQEHAIVIMEAPPLARALYQHTELEDEIPTSLYTAVAQVLAYVFQLREWKSHGGFEPLVPELLDIPSGMDPLKANGESK